MKIRIERQLSNFKALTKPNYSWGDSEWIEFFKTVYFRDHPFDTTEYEFRIGYGGSSRNRLCSIRLIHTQGPKFGKTEVTIDAKKPFVQNKIFKKTFSSINTG